MEEAQRKVDKAVEQAYNDGCKKVKVLSQTFLSPTEGGELVDLGEVAMGQSLQLSAPTDSTPINKPGLPPGNPDVPSVEKKWEYWLEMFVDGEWVEVKDRRYEFTDQEAFNKSLNAYEKIIDKRNRRNLQTKQLQYRLRSREATIDPAKSLAGTSWTRRDPEGNITTYTFESDRTVSYSITWTDGITESFRSNGQWKQSGDSVQISLNKGAFEVTATIKADRIEGEAQTAKGKRVWTILKN